MSKVKFGPQTLLYPQPAFLIGVDVDKKPNFLAVAWGGVACGSPPMVSVAINHSRHTIKGIKQNMAFSLKDFGALGTDLPIRFRKVAEALGISSSFDFND